MSSSIFENDSLENESRSDTFEEIEGVEAPLAEQIPKKLLKQLQKEKVGLQVVDLWQQANANRQDWLTRQKSLAEEIDEFIEPLYSPSLKWSSTLHFPVALTVCKTYHARMYSATLGQDPPFTTTARKEANTERAPLVQELMRYGVRDWANHNKGIEEPVDEGIWSWVTAGTVIWKMGWEKDLSRYLDVERRAKTAVRVEIDPATEREVEKEIVVGFEEVEVEKAKVLFNGPSVYRVFPEDIVLVDLNLMSLEPKLAGHGDDGSGAE